MPKKKAQLVLVPQLARIEVLDLEVPTLDKLGGLLYTHQRRAIESPHRYGVYNWSRQSGKSKGLTLRRLLRGMKRRKDQIMLSRGARQSRLLMEKVREWLQVMDVLAENGEFEDVFEDKVERVMFTKLPRFGLTIYALPASPDTSRGYSGDVLLDEFAMHKNSMEIWKAVFPSVTAVQGEVDVCSTPKGQQDMFYRLCNNPDYYYDKVTIHDAVAGGLKADIEDLRKGAVDEDTWREEFLCEFVDEATAFLTWQEILACEDDKLPLELDVEALAKFAGDVYVGIDVGRSTDPTIIWAAELIGSTLISKGMIRLKNVPFNQQREILYAVLGCRCVRRAAIDASPMGRNLYDDCANRFGSKIEGCTFSGSNKEELAGAFRTKVLDKNFRIPADEKLRNDLHSVQKTRTSFGNVRLAANREDGMHGDQFWAGSLIVHAAGTPYVPLEMTFGDPFEERELP